MFQSFVPIVPAVELNFSFYLYFCVLVYRVTAVDCVTFAIWLLHFQSFVFLFFSFLRQTIITRFSYQ